jgi:hypothetical protein
LPPGSAFSPEAGVFAGFAARARACSLRRLRFSRSAAASRAAFARSAGFGFLFIKGGYPGHETVSSFALPSDRALWQTLPSRRICPRFSTPVRCRSSVVEHLIGNEEVHSSILCGSTSHPASFANFRREYFLRDLPLAVDLEKAEVVGEVARRQLTLELNKGGGRR